MKLFRKSVSNPVFIISCVFVLCMEGCEKSPVSSQEDTSDGLDGWKISKSNYDFDINPREIFFVNPSEGFAVGYNGDISKITNSYYILQYALIGLAG
jgi:hypothetical protein